MRRPALVAGLRLYRLSHSVSYVCLLTVAHAPIHEHKRITTQCVTRQDRHSTATACNTRQGAPAQIISDCLMRLLLGCWAGHPARRASRRRDAKKPLYGVIRSHLYKLSRRPQKTRLRAKTRKLGVFWAVARKNDRLESPISPLILAAQGLDRVKNRGLGKNYITKKPAAGIKLGAFLLSIRLTQPTPYGHGRAAATPRQCCNRADLARHVCAA